MTRCAVVRESRLGGEVRVSGSKHVAQLGLIAAALTANDIVLDNAPVACLDVRWAAEMVRGIGKYVCLHDNHITVVEPTGSLNPVLKEAPSGIRGTPQLLAALLGRCDSATVPLPTGCRLNRPIDLHLNILRSMGARIVVDENRIVGWRSGRLRGCHVNLPVTSVGATETAILAGVLAEGITSVRGGNLSPLVQDLVRLVQAMGAKVAISDDAVLIEGVRSLAGARFAVRPDASEAITLAIAAGLVGRGVAIRDCLVGDIEYPLYCLSKIGAQVDIVDDHCVVVSAPNAAPLAFSVTADRHPRFPSDSQPPLSVVALLAHGRSWIADFRFPDRFFHIAPLRSMGAVISRHGNGIAVAGDATLRGAIVNAHDIRTGWALVVAGMVSSGETTIMEFEQVERGYETPVLKLRELGCDIDVEGE